ncbi:MAG: NIPSNAP family protein [Caulobacteraceae bacterium]|nr:NIPSNAP family protein [Caulobacteraceae bacterium]
MTDTIFEFRDYTLHAGQREALIDLFEREFIEPQEALGAHVRAIFRDLERPDRFVWLRSFADAQSRFTALDGFYTGPIWQKHRAAANATIADSDNVMQLRPLSGTLGAGAGGSPFISTAYVLVPTAETDFIARFQRDIAPTLGVATLCHVHHRSRTEPLPAATGARERDGLLHARWRVRRAKRTKPSKKNSAACSLEHQRSGAWSQRRAPPCASSRSRAFPRATR